jgi:hypothetical protein
MRVVLLVAGVVALAVPASTTAQLPPVPTVPPAPVPVPTVPPVPTAVPLPKPPPAPVPTVVPVPTTPPSVPVPSVPGVTGPSGGGGSSSSGGGGSSSSGGGGGSTSSPGNAGSAAAPSAPSSGGGARGGSSSSGRDARAHAARRTPAQRHRAERRLRRMVTRLSFCLDNLTTVQRRVLVLRTGLGSARPHSRRGVARLLDLRVRRVARIERRGVRDARRLSRAGACGGGGGATTTPTALAGGGGSESSGGGLVPVPDKDQGNVAGESSGHDSTTGSGDVRGESETRLPPPLIGGDGRDAGGVSLAIGIALVLLALIAGFATPHMRARVRSS